MTNFNVKAETQHDIYLRIAERNRRNAQHSTGPRTPEGKARSCRNALKRGYSLTNHQILNNENPEAYEQMFRDLQAIYNPKSDREHLAVLEISHCMWAIRRLDIGEVTLINSFVEPPEVMADDPDGDVTGGEAIGYLAILKKGEPEPDEFRSIQLIQRYRRYWDRRLEKARMEFSRAASDRRQDELAEIRKQQEQIKLDLLKRKQQKEQEREEQRRSSNFITQVERVLRKKSTTKREVDALRDLLTGFVPRPEEDPATQQAAG